MARYSQSRVKRDCVWLFRTLSFATVIWTTAPTAAARGALVTSGQSSASERVRVASFTAQRHPDTIATQGSYPVVVRQLSGPDAVGGRVEYSIWNARGKETASGRVKLSNSDPRQWMARLPGRPAGSVITYHYVLFTRAGAKFRHPSSPSANYQFRVVPFRLLSLKVRKSEVEAGHTAQVALAVQTASPIAGEIVLRLLPSSSKDTGELHINFSEEERAASADGLSATMRAKLPALLPGQAADFYFRLHNQNGDATLPEDAPAQVYSVKRPLTPVQCIPVKERFVLGVVAAGAQRWVSLKSGGVWGGDIGAGLRHWGTCQGIFSNIARFAAPDAVGGLAYIGNDHGVVEVGGDVDTPVAILRPEPSAWGRSSSAFARLGRAVRAGPGVLSPLSGTLLFQFQREQVLEEHFPLAVFFQIDAGKLTEYSFPIAGRRIVGLSSAAFDAVDGCWLLGAFVTDSQENLKPSVVRRCGDSVQQILLQEFQVQDSKGVPQRVIASTRDPATGSLTVALEFQVSKGHTPTAYGVFRVQETSGQLTALAPELSDMETEITSLAADWGNGRILVGTFGDNLWQVKDGNARKLEFADKIPAQITAVSVDDASGRTLIGTSDGAFELVGPDRISSLVPPTKDALPADSLPMDVNAATGEVLFSSYSAGLTELQRHGEEEWHPRALPQGGTQLPNGHFGDAQFTRNGGIAAVLYSRGLLLLGKKEVQVLGPKEGLYSTNLFRVLTLHSGELLVAYAPLPFGPESQGAIQLLKDTEIAQTFKMPDRGSATIGRWIEVPERKSVFAATPAGVVEIRGDGSVATISPNPASSIARSPDFGSIGAVGSTIERWDGQKFVPVFYQVDHPRWPKGAYQPGSPIDVTIDSNNMWYILYKGGVLAVLNQDEQFLNILDAEDGIPATAQRLLAIPGIGKVFVGSTAEGVVIVGNKHRQ